MNCCGAVDETLHCVRFDDDPLPDLTLVHNSLVDHPIVDDTMPDDTLVNNLPILNHAAVIYDPHPGITLVENPHVYNPSIENHVHRCVLPASNSSTCPSPTVEKALPDLPYHIITDILTRLPTECVLRCQRASKLLEILVTTPFFIRAHLARRATSIISLHSWSQSNNREIRFYFIDEQTKVEEANLKLDFCYSDLTKDYPSINLEERPLMLYDSYDGFLLLRNRNYICRSIFVIWNPTTEEQVTILTKGIHFVVCAFYFNPHNKEYEVLLQDWEHSDVDLKHISFDILSFGSKLRKKYKLQRNIGRFWYMPRSERSPIIINGTIYWMVDSVRSDAKFGCSASIMAFEIGTNKFSTMQHAGDFCDDCSNSFGPAKHNRMQLIEMEGQLGLCVILSNTELELWLLNPATNSWAKTHTVTLPENSSCAPNYWDVEVKVKDGKLLVRQKNILLLCNLDLNTHEIIEKKGFEEDNFGLVFHTHSLVSLDTDHKMIQLGYRSDSC